MGCTPSLEIKAYLYRSKQKEKSGQKSKQTMSTPSWRHGGYAVWKPSHFETCWRSQKPKRGPRGQTQDRGRNPERRNSGKTTTLRPVPGGQGPVGTKSLTAATAAATTTESQISDFKAKGSFYKVTRKNKVMYPLCFIYSKLERERVSPNNS